MGGGVAGVSSGCESVREQQQENEREREAGRAQQGSRGGANKGGRGCGCGCRERLLVALWPPARHQQRNVVAIQQDLVQVRDLRSASDGVEGDRSGAARRPAAGLRPAQAGRCRAAARMGASPAPASPHLLALGRDLVLRHVLQHHVDVNIKAPAASSRMRVWLVEAGGACRRRRPAAVCRRPAAVGAPRSIPCTTISTPRA